MLVCLLQQIKAFITCKLYLLPEIMNLNCNSLHCRNCKHIGGVDTVCANHTRSVQLNQAIQGHSCFKKLIKWDAYRVVRCIPMHLSTHQLYIVRNVCLASYIVFSIFFGYNHKDTAYAATYSQHDHRSCRLRLKLKLLQLASGY